MKNLKKICLLALCIVSLYGASAQTEATYYTNKGSFKVVLTDTLTPRTVDSFIARVSQKFYDGLTFHRVIDGFMIQGGDPNGDGTGGPGYTIPDEFDPSLKNIPGALAMANAGANTDGCQFFINLVTNAYLDNHYTVFGMVTANFTVVQTIGHVPTNPTNNKPLTDVVMDSIRITHVHTAAVKNITNGPTASIYPNPTSGLFSIDLPGVATKVEVVNMLGRIVYSTEANETLKVDLRNELPGFYVVRMSNADGAWAGRVMVE